MTEFNADNYDDVRVITESELNNLTKLEKDEYLLKVIGTTGFMAKLTAKKELPASFMGWRSYGANKNPPTVYVITESFRRGWQFVKLRSGTSAAWVVLKHPYGFTIEINSEAFKDVADKITMVNGKMVTPCYYQAKFRNAKLLVEKDDNQDFFYSLIRAISDDKPLVKKLKSTIEEERPDKIYTVLTSSKY